jgi:hypothetical protein
VKPKKKSAKKTPMSMVKLRSLLTKSGLNIRDEVPVREVRLEVPMVKGDFKGRFYIYMSDGDESAYLRCNVAISVPKERAEEAIRLFRRLHEMN